MVGFSAMAYGPKSLTISCDAEHLTRYGGLHYFAQFLKRLGIRDLLGKRVKIVQRNNRYSVPETILSLLYPIVLGLERIETAEILRRNGVFHYLTGLRSYPHPTALRRFLKRTAPHLTSQLVRFHDQLRTVMLGRPHPRTSIVIDLDSTVCTLYGNQEGAMKGYNPHKRGRKSYHPLLAVTAGLGDTLDGVLRPGNVSSAHGTRELLERIFGKLPEAVRTIRLRADKGFYDGKIIKYLNENRVGFVIAAKVTNPLRYSWYGKKFRAFAPGFAVTEFDYQPHQWHQPYRFVVIRREIPEEDTEQLKLFKLGKFFYAAFVTNLEMKPENVWRFYRDRAALELLIKELKYSYPLAKIPTHDFQANEAYFHLLLLTYDLVNWYQRLCLPEEYQRMTLERLRAKLFSIPAELVHRGNRPALKFPAHRAYEHLFAEIERGVRKLKPVRFDARRRQSRSPRHPTS